MPELNPKVLSWARETADLSTEEAARKIGLRDSRKGTAEERLRAIEAGREEPTRSLLGRMARTYRQPLLALYLQEPPRRTDRGEDFRTLPADYREEEEALVDNLLRDIRVRQMLIRAALEEEEEAEGLEWVGAARPSDRVDPTVHLLEELLGLDRDDLRATSSPMDGFALARECAEQAGAFVLLIGDLGSHHTQIDVDVFRGFSLADPVAPFVVVNDQDARAAWTFTLLHEFVHLVVGVTGVSAGTPSGDVEQFCNSVASHFLVSMDELKEVAAALPATVDAIAERLNAYADRWNVSRSLLAYRLLRSGEIERSVWSRLSSRFEREWRDSREKRKLAVRAKEGGPSYYTVRRHRLGPRLLEVTSRMLYAGALTTTRASQVLGVSPKNVGRLLRDSPGG